MQNIVSIATMNAELQKRALAAELKFDCGAAGKFDADIAFIAEAPGDREVELKMPLTGGSGKLLWDTLRHEKYGKLTRASVYITNVVKRKLINPQGEKHTKKAPIGKQELSQWEQILLEELSFLPNLRYVVLMGNFALHAVLGENGITQWRGSGMEINLQGRKVWVLVINNPAYVLHEPKQEIVFRMDLVKLERIRNGQFQIPKFVEHINPSYQQARDYIAAAREAHVPIAYDIETLRRSTACVGLAYSNNEGMCISFRTDKNNTYPIEQERQLRLDLAGLFTDSSTQFIAQNGNFDSSWLGFMDRIHVNRNWFDTMLAHHVLYPPLPHNLGFLTSQYTDHPYYKDDGKEWRTTGDLDTFWRYNVKDCCITRIVQEKLLEELRERNLDKFFFEHVMRLQPHLVKMTVNGVKCDTSAKRAIADDFTRSTTEARDLCIQSARLALGDTDFSFNPRSWPDLQDLFFNRLKLVGRGTTTNEENRRRMYNHPRTTEASRTLLRNIDTYLERAKFLSTYANSRLDDDGRFRCEYSQIGVASTPGRLSSRKTMWENGLNLQNIPPLAQGMFIADEGYEFTYFDMAQIEARFVACFANIEPWLEQFELARTNPGSYDAHRALATMIYKVPYEEVPAADFIDGRPTIRYKSKRARHGLNYRMAPDRFASTNGLSLAEAESLYNEYHRLHPQLKRWWDDLRNEVRDTRKLVSPLGREWLLLERLTDDALDAIVAFKPQSTAGDHVASVIYKCENDPRWPKLARVVLNIHDALITLNRIEDGPLVRQIQKEYAEAPLVIGNHTMIVPAEFGKSEPDEHGVHRWSTIKKIK